jgi:hypothetical protein
MTQEELTELTEKVKQFLGQEMPFSSKKGKVFYKFIKITNSYGIAEQGEQMNFTAFCILVSPDGQKKETSIREVLNFFQKELPDK